jgi:hypothetical protein
VLIEEVMPDKSSRAAGQVFEPDRPHKSLPVLGRRLKTKVLVTGLEVTRRPDMPSKSVGGRKLAGGFDSRPPPPLKVEFDQRRSADPGERQPLEGPDRGPRDRVHHTSLSVFPPRHRTSPWMRAGGLDESRPRLLQIEEERAIPPVDRCVERETGAVPSFVAMGVPLSRLPRS